jgi:Tfp pilus assembly PilM family ATPase
VIDRFRRVRHPLVCLDFGRDQLTAIEVVDGVLTRWASQPLAEDALRNGDPIVPAVVGEAVRYTLVRAGIQARHARLALPDEATVSRQLFLPLMPRRDLSRAMHYVAEKHIPFPIARARWSWDVVERSRDGVWVYLVATWRDVVERFSEVARFAGLVPQVLEPRSLAVARAVDQDHALLVDAGARRLYATLLVRGQPTFVDEVLLGPDLTDRREALDRLVQRAYRYQSTVGGATGRLAPVLLAGELELSKVELPIRGTPIGELLNGQLPAAPRGFRPGGFLANLGLSMRGQR